MNPAIFAASETRFQSGFMRWRFYCSDGRWGEAFDEFCHAGLGLPRYDRFAVPGGPAWESTMRDVSLRPKTRPASMSPSSRGRTRSNGWS